MSERSLLVSEVFGPTVQGEGPRAGRRCGFVRTGLCNLHCSWCDTPYTWDWTGRNGHAYDRDTEVHRVSIGTLAKQVEEMGVGWCVITGGEPLVQAPQVRELAEALLAADIGVQVETNGTRLPWRVPEVEWSVSPKLGNAGMEASLCLKGPALRAFAQAPVSAFKFVACTTGDLDEIQAIVDTYDLPCDRIWVMPEGRSADVIRGRLMDLADAVIARGWNLTGRLHVMTWGDERGR